MKVAVAGASGFIGRGVCAALRASGHEVLSMGRGPASDIRWDPVEGVFNEGERERVRGCDAVVHVAGATIARRWTEARKREILDSRVISTRLLAEALASAPRRTRVFVSGSAIGYYGNRGDEWLDESSTAGFDFLAGVAAAWEKAADPARAAGIRVVHPRIGLVLDWSGGGLAVMRLPFLLGLGGPMGNGRQWMSWISLHDLTRVVALALAADSPLAGVVNTVAPNPVRNTEYARTLGRVLRRPAVLPTPGFALRAVFGEMADVVALASQRVRPAVLESVGFRFDHPTLESALRQTSGK